MMNYLSNEVFTTFADLKITLADFNRGDKIMVHQVWKVPKRAYKKLHPKNIEPYKILKKISSNTYVFDLLEDMGIRSSMLKI